jgi:hypothetical protein
MDQALGCSWRGEKIQNLEMISQFSVPLAMKILIAAAKLSLVLVNDWYSFPVKCGETNGLNQVLRVQEFEEIA